LWAASPAKMGRQIGWLSGCPSRQDCVYLNRR